MENSINITTRQENEKNQEKTNLRTFIFQNIWVDLLSYISILFVLAGTLHMGIELLNTQEQLRKIKPDYPFPQFSNLLPSIYYFIILIGIHEMFLKLTADRFAKYLSPKYYDEKTKDMTLVNLNKKKVATNLFKFCFYLSSTILGYYVLKESQFLPSTLFGKGEFKNLFIDNFNNALFYEKPDVMDVYYNLNLAFALFDGYILVMNPLQSDFLFMVLHHSATYSLIVFSYMTNHTAIGSTIYLLFYVGDIFSYIVRTLVHLNFSDFFIVSPTIVFLIVFTYTRLFVFGDLLHKLITVNTRWEYLETYLCGFLCFLMALNMLWIILITKKLLNYFKTGKIEEIYKYKTVKVNTN